MLLLLEVWSFCLGSGIPNPVCLVLQFIISYFCPLQYQSICLSRHSFLSISSGNSVFRLLTIALLLVFMSVPVGLLMLHQALNFLGGWAFGSFKTLPMNLPCLIAINALMFGMW